MRDNDANPVPSAAEVQTVKAAINEILPANTSEDDNIVRAPVAVPLDYTFTLIDPDTATMREAIDASIQQFHAEETSVGVNVDEDKYRAAIANTVDPATGDELLNFVLSAPSGDQSIAANEISTKGVVTLP